MTGAHFIAVTTNEIGPAGPAKQIFAAAFGTPEDALEVVTAKLKPGETARWLDCRALAIRPGEFRALYVNRPLSIRRAT